MIRISVAQTSFRTQSGVSKRTGKDYSMRIQSGYAYTKDRDGNQPPFPEKFDIILDNGADPFPVGDYTLDASAIYVDRQGNLAVATRLKSIQAKA